MKLLCHFPGGNKPAKSTDFESRKPLMAQSEPLSVKDVVSLMLKCISAPRPTAQDPFIYRRRATEISGGWKNEGKQPADRSVIAG